MLDLLEGSGSRLRITGEGEGPTPSRRIGGFLRSYWAWGGLGALLLLFAVLKLYSLNFVMGDEHMYNYMSLMVTEGKWPYRDFFFSHPPGQIYLMGALYALFGYSLELSKSLPSIAAMISGVFTFMIGRRLLGAKEGLIGCALFLFTFDVIRGSAHFTGANVALAFLLAATYQVIARRPLIGGLLYALGTITGVYVLPMGLMMTVLVAFRSWKESVKLLASLGLVLAGLCLLFWSVAGEAFWYQVVTYNLHKVPMAHSWFDKFRDVFFLNTPVMLGFLPAIAWGAVMWKTEGRVRKEGAGNQAETSPSRRFVGWLDLWSGDRIAAVILLSVLVFGYFFFYSTRDDYYSYYFMLIMPWMGLLTAHMVIDAPRFVWNHFRSASDPTEEQSRGRETRQSKRRRERAAMKRAKSGKPVRRTLKSPARLWPLLVPLVVLVGVLNYRQKIGEQRLARYSDTVKHYEWVDSKYLGPTANGMIRRLFWNPVRDRRHPPTALARYLQHETNHASDISEFMEKVQDECEPDTRIFGEYSLGPFAAAASDCVLGADIADTNPHRWKVGESKTEDWVRDLEADNLEIVVIREGSSILRTKVMRDYIYKTFPRVSYRWKSRYLGYVELRRREE